MAHQDVRISGSQHTARMRSPLVTALLSLIPFYWLYWYFAVNNEMSKLGEVRSTDELGTSPTMSLIAVTLGVVLIVPPIISIWNTANRVNQTQHMSGEQVGLSKVLATIVTVLLFPVGAAMMQASLNHAWKNQAG
jgi:hypothetical protein